MSIQDRNRRQAHHDRAVSRLRHEPGALLITVRYPIRRWCEGTSSFSSAQFGPAQTTSAGWRVPASEEGVWAETEPEYCGPRSRTFDGGDTGLAGVRRDYADCRVLLLGRSRARWHARSGIIHGPCSGESFRCETSAGNRRRIVDSAHSQEADPRSESVLDEFR